MGMRSKSTQLVTLVFILLLLSAGVSWGVPAYVKYESFACTNTPCPLSSYTFTYTSAGSGNTLLLSLRTSAQGTFTVTSPDLTWTLDAQQNYYSSWTLQVWRASNITTGNHTITVSKSSGTTYFRVVVTEWSGLGISPTVVDYASANGGGTTVNPGDTVTTSADNSLLFVAVGADSDDIVYTAGTNFTLRSLCPTNGEPDQKLCIESREPVSAGTYSNGMGFVQSGGQNNWAVIFAAYAPLPAFPGAEGFGTTTPGGRGGTIYRVTNLNTSGVGSLAYCVAQSGPRTCVFTTGGTINGGFTISNPYITIAGQTAPGGGIVIRNGDVIIKTHDVVIRNLSFRRGPGGQTHGIDATYNNNTSIHDVVIDHCSMSWGTDSCGESWYQVHNYTWSWNFFTEGLEYSTHPDGQHSKASFLAGYLLWESGAGTGGSYNISYHHNLTAHYNERGPTLEDSGLNDIVNNVAYDVTWDFSNIISCDPNNLTQGNYVCNYFKKGTAPGTREITPITLTCANNSTDGAGTEYYLQGNIGPNRTSDAQAQNLVVASGYRTVAAQNTTGSPVDHMVNSRFASAPAITTTSAAQAYIDVLAEGGAGNSRYIDCNGNWVNRRDAVDKRIVYEVQHGTGRIIDAPGYSTCLGACVPLDIDPLSLHHDYLTQADYTAAGVSDPMDADLWPVIASGTACTDTDGDGMPDAWETAHGLNPNSAADANGDYDGTGYTNLEKYFSGLYGPAGDTTPPTVTILTTDPSRITSNSLSITGTATDAVGVTSCKYRIGAAPTASLGTALTGTTSWSGTATGFSLGANTLYVGCTDAAGNWGTAAPYIDSMTVNYITVLAPKAMQIILK